ncbi:unnamed protein product [Rotaria sp. Silwood1]|nr:unnamed protein product [Rotaria sp. Silwood1]CAF1651695.1 unnamed protein product [Rotaria sp. Silwood1]CAF3929708.1 unnamed protein product [Rotaria sp. Silwood1]CAF4992349.1 unnamed protein product [Rotaria sp. Silwood1]CAF4994021.1 unnamed protein product [Rotaria sp. Silwood1]
MVTNQQEYDEKLLVLQERFPQESKDKIIRLLQRHNGNIDQVRARLVQREYRVNKWTTLETRFGAAVTTLQQELPSTQSMKRIRLLKIMEHFSGDSEQARDFLQVCGEQHHKHDENSNVSRHEKRKELREKYATQLAELSTAGINVNCPCVLRQLEKNQGDVTKVMERMSRHRAKKEKITELHAKYANQIAQLETDGSTLRKQQKLSVDDIENLKRLRSAGIHGNPMKVLATFHECDESIEMTVARIQQEREQRHQCRDGRKLQRNILAEAENGYIKINNRDDWPRDIELVYLDGNNMMFVVHSLRRLCLNRSGKKTERALGEIASAWNEQMHIPYVELIFDSTHQLDQIGTVKISSAQPKYRTTDDMLVEISRQPENREKNKRTIIVTSDRGLAALLQHEGCLIVKSYNWFAHCVMTLTPDLINYQELTGTMTIPSTPATKKIRYNFDELVHRIANIDI